jgi:hypothetical protein
MPGSAFHCDRATDRGFPDVLGSVKDSVMVSAVNGRRNIPSEQRKTAKLVGQILPAVINPVEDLSLWVLCLRQDRFAIDLQRRLKPGT